MGGRRFEFLLGRRGATRVYCFTAVPVDEGGIPPEDVLRYMSMLKR